MGPVFPTKGKASRAGAREANRINRPGAAAYWFEIVAMLPSIFSKLIVNGSA